MIFYVCMRNRVDSRDDEVWKVRAKTAREAKKICSEDNWRGRFLVGYAYSASDFKVVCRDWYDLLSHLAPRNDT